MKMNHYQFYLSELSDVEDLAILIESDKLTQDAQTQNPITERMLERVSVKCLLEAKAIQETSKAGAGTSAFSYAECCGKWWKAGAARYTALMILELQPMSVSEPSKSDLEFIKALAIKRVEALAMAGSMFRGDPKAIKTYAREDFQHRYDQTFPPAKNLISIPRSPS